MKLSVSCKKGKQSFRRAGLSFTCNPIVLTVDNDMAGTSEEYITEDQAELLKNEAMLVVDVIEKSKNTKSVKKTTKKRGRPKKKKTK